MPLALLLSPDDQAVSAITAVLEEMSVTCERPLDGVSAAKKLNSHNFDLVLVDCENLPAAKLIFDVCRRGRDGHNPVPIAIVDGRAGLPTAFRLGAELILTKPVAKDQARSTIRTAVGRVKKDEPARVVQVAESNAVEDSAPAEASMAEAGSAEARLTNYESTAEAANHSTADARALAAAAPSPAPSFEEPAPRAGSSSAATSMSAGASFAPEIRSAPATAPVPVLTEPKLDSGEQLGEDPVLAELDKGETAPKTAPTPAPPAPVFSFYAETRSEKKKTRGPLVAVLALVVICGGLYAAWMTQPAFRAMVQPGIDRVLALAGMAHSARSSAAAPSAAKPAAPAAPAPAALSENGQVSTLGADASATNEVPSATGTMKSASSGSAVAAAAAPISGATTTPAAAASDKIGSENKIAALSVSSTKAGDNHNGAGASASDGTLPGKPTAIILSSKGAEKRLLHSVQPSYPASASAPGTEGTIVLKALVDEGGEVADAKIVEGNPVLAESAISAVKQWRYRPYLRDGKAVPFQTIVLIDFQRP
jgi:TonB family protein